MENKILIDTSILVDLQRGKVTTVKQFETIQNKVAISRITACEFIYGSTDKQEKKINKEFLNALWIYEVNEEVSKHTYKLLDKYGLQMKLGIADAMIASTAIIHGLPLWTLNIRHFSKITTLSLY